MSEPNAKVQASGEELERFGYKQELKRQLGLRDVVLYGVLFMVIIAPQSIWGLVSVQSEGLSTLVYIIGFIAISFTAMSYVQMSKKFPIAGSVYSYVQRGINPHVGFISGWLILLDYCITPALLYVLVANWGTLLIPESPWFLWIIVFVAFNTFATIRGMSITKGTDIILFIVEILAVIAFIWLGCTFILGGGGTGAFVADPIWQPGKVDAHFVAAGISIAALNFLGFDGISTLAEETVEPEKNIGRGIMIALGIIIVVFFLQTYIASLIQPDWATWSDEHAENAFFYGVQMIGGDVFYKIMLVVNIVAVGIANVANAQLAASRLLYGMGRDKVIPGVFGKVHPKYQTPWFAAIFIGVMVLVLSFVGMSTLATVVNFGALAAFIILNFAVFYYFFIKHGCRNGVGDFLKYLICPWIGIIILAYVFTGFDTLTYTVGIAWLIIGLIIGAVKSKGYKEVPEAFKNMEF